jgi:DNA repair protein RadC
VVSEGAADSAALPTREILAAVLRRDGTAFALVHNNPLGDPEPSRTDVIATDELGQTAT